MGQIVAERRVVISIPPELSEDDLACFMKNLEAEPWWDATITVERVGVKITVSDRCIHGLLLKDCNLHD